MSWSKNSAFLVTEILWLCLVRPWKSTKCSETVWWCLAIVLLNFGFKFHVFFHFSPWNPHILFNFSMKFSMKSGIGWSWLIFRSKHQHFPRAFPRCFRNGAEVTQIGPGRVAVEVLIDGLHESRSEPRIFLEVMPVTWSIHRFMDGFYVLYIYVCPSGKLI